MIEKLKKLGLTSYESRAYLTLLKLGDSEADEIAINAKIPMGRIYNVLSTLEEAHLVRTQDTRPRRYGSVEPSVALGRLFKNKHEELKQKTAEIENLVSDLKSQLSGVVTRKTDKSFWTVARGEESFELIHECIIGARKELLFFYASRMMSERLKKDVLNMKYSEIMDTLLKSLKKGTEVKVIFSKEVDISSLEDSPAVRQLLIHLGSGLDVRLAAIPATPFDIIDGETVLLSMLNPLDPEELFAVVKITDTKLAEELRGKFFSIWENADVYTG